MTDLHSEKAAGAAAPNPQPSPQTPPKPAAKRPPRQEQEKPVRRVGSVTLGLCLMAVGVCFLCYYFVPGFDWLLVVKVGAPLALVGPPRPLEVRFPGRVRLPCADGRRLLPDFGAAVLGAGFPRAAYPN